MRPYYKLRDELKTGDLLLYRSSSVLGWLIRMFSRANVNHAGLVIRLSEYGDLSDRRFTLEALEGGIVLRILSRRLRKFKGDVYWYPLQDQFESYRNDIGAWALEKVGIQYDYGSLFKQALCRVSADAEKFFCSEYSQIAYTECGIIEPLDYALTPGEMSGLGIFKAPRVL